MNRRQFLLSGLAGSSLLMTGCAGKKSWLRYMVENGLYNDCLSGLPTHLKNHALMQQIWEGIDASQVWDSHVHLVGTGDANQGAWHSPKMDSLWHPLLKTQKHFYMNGGCVDDSRVDASYVDRLAHLIAEMPQGFKTILFAFEWFHDDNGQSNQEASIFHVPNNYTAKIATQYPDYFEWVASIHPYRADGLEALTLAHAKGARAIKWLPSAMNIDPASKQCDRFYQKLAELNLPIICHTGRERAVQGGNQSYGNPLKLRRALDAGVKVILAHCASDGEDIDLDQGQNGKMVKSFTLFTRMMDTPQYEGQLFGEISAITIINHVEAIQPILEKTEWHHRLINGSDYPLPGILLTISPAQLADEGLLDPASIPFLLEVRHYNQLMFDFAVKRLLRYKGKGFPRQVFETRQFFESQVPAKPMNNARIDNG
ncbi:MAG: amidohydrolase family protein [Methylophilaceae bacterium]